MRRTLLLIAFTACAPRSDLADTGQARQSVLGADTFDGSCNNDQENLILQAERFGRRVAASSAFADCMQRAISSAYTFNGPYGSAIIGPYIKCQPDPIQDGTPASVILADALSVARSTNNLQQGCTPDRQGGTIAFTSLNYGLVHNYDEGFQWIGPIVTDEVTASSSPTLCPGSGLSVPQCRYAFPWPLDGMAGSAWHEASHTHGFEHDGCGTEPAGWNMVQNSMPYIIQQCITAAAQDSARANAGGPNLSNGCPRGQLSMATVIGGTTTQCVDDPRLSTLTFAGARGTLSSAAGLYTLDGAGNIYRRVGSSWQWIGFPGLQFAVNEDALYAITSDSSQVVRYTPATGWVQIGTSSSQLVAGGHRLFSIAPNGTIWRWNNSAFNWMQIGQPVYQALVAPDSTLYALTSDHATAMKFTDQSGWQIVGPGGAALFLTGSTLNKVASDQLSISRLSSGTWSTVVTSSAILLGRFSGGESGQIYNLFGGKLTQYRGANGRTLEILAEDAIDSTFYGGHLYVDRTNLGVYELLRP